MKKKIPFTPFDIHYRIRNLIRLVTVREAIKLAFITTHQFTRDLKDAKDIKPKLEKLKQTPYDQSYTGCGEPSFVINNNLDSNPLVVQSHNIASPNLVCDSILKMTKNNKTNYLKEYQAYLTKKLNENVEFIKKNIEDS
jgi:hypothetical protein